MPVPTLGMLSAIWYQFFARLATPSGVYGPEMVPMTLLKVFRMPVMSVRLSGS
ncbi:hypothetical protein MAHJHV51_42960 [Mycobacterium avium subsp. hominissuis]